MFNNKPLFCKADFFLEYVLQENSDTNLFAIIDTKVYEYHHSLINKFFTEENRLILDSGDENKNLDTTIKIWQAFMNAKLDRYAHVFIIGGGVLGDMGAFACSTFKRGVNFSFLPTTVLAQVDASIGAKTGINFNYIKNSIGTFAQPQNVVVDVQFLETLPERETIAGWVEAIKIASTCDKSFFEYLFSTKTTYPLSEEMIQQAVKNKLEIVNQDPLEKNIRKILNYGHTIGHAYESVMLDCNKPILHGEAIACGMLVETLWSCVNKNVNLETYNKIKLILEKWQCFKFVNFENMPKFECLIPYLYQDKKNKNQQILLALPLEIGKGDYEVVALIDSLQNSWNEIKEYGFGK